MAMVYVIFVYIMYIYSFVTSFQIKVTFPAGIDVNDYIITSNMPLKTGTTYVTEGQTLSASFQVKQKISLLLSYYQCCLFNFELKYTMFVILYI